MRTLPLATWVLCLCAALGCGAPRTVLRGGPVLTMDAEDRVVEALGIEGERIASVGSEAEVLAWAGDGARVVDLAGRALVPGFVDAHGHFPGEGVYTTILDLNAPPIGEVEDMEGLVGLLRERAEETPAGEWVSGMSYDDTLLAERRHPTRADLDRASTEHPIAVLHVSGHLAVANSRALAELGIDRDTPDPDGGIYRRDAEGVPDGVLEETAMESLQAMLLSPGLLDGIRIMREGTRRALSNGVTTAQNGYAPAGQISLFQWVERLGMLPLRLVLWPGMEVVDEVLAGERTLPKLDGPKLWIGAVKVIADGSIQGYTGYLSEPYHVPPGDDPSYRGYPRIDAGELRERITRYHAAGFPLAVHGNGDASIDDILDAFEHAFAEHPREDPRPIIIHAQMSRPDQLDRMAALGVVPSFFSLHTFYWGDRHRTLFMGPERAARMSPAASALAKGVRFTIHCDAPVVPLEPLRLVWSAVNRRTRSDVVVGPDERISPMQALRAVTIDAAWSMFLDEELGSLEPGKLADLAILSESPLARPEAIDEIQVLETWVGGEAVFQYAD